MTEYSDNLTVADVQAVLRALPDHEITGDEIERLTKELDEARAQVAAAYGSAADALQNVAENWDCGHNDSRLCDCARDAEQWGFAADEARSMTPAHAQSALESYGREKVREGMMRAAALFPVGSRDGGTISSTIRDDMEKLNVRT